MRQAQVGFDLGAKSSTIPLAIPKQTLILLGALMLGETTINYIDRQVVSVLAPTLRDEFGWSNFQYANIVNAFLITSAVAYSLAGWVLDKLGIRRGLTLAASALRLPRGESAMFWTRSMDTRRFSSGWARSCQSP